MIIKIKKNHLYLNNIVISQVLCLQNFTILFLNNSKTISRFQLINSNLLKYHYHCINLMNAHSFTWKH